MPLEYRPSMKMYEVVWERDGECVSRFYVDAASELDAISGAEAFLAEYPKFNFDRSYAAVHVRILPSTYGPSRLEIGS
jgi:hypothetical protein